MNLAWLALALYALLAVVALAWVWGVSCRWFDRRADLRRHRVTGLDELWAAALTEPAWTPPADELPAAWTGEPLTLVCRHCGEEVPYLHPSQRRSERAAHEACTCPALGVQA